MEGSAGSYEYLVFFSTFVALAKHYGLEVVVDYQMPRLEALLDPVRTPLAPQAGFLTVCSSV